MHCVRFFQISHDYAKSPLMEGMDDTTSLKDSTETDENEDAKISVDKNVLVKNGFDKNDGTTPAVDPESQAEPDGAKMQDFDPKVEELLEPAKFAPKDLLALLRNIEAEIHQVGIHLKSSCIAMLQKGSSVLMFMAQMSSKWK